MTWFEELRREFRTRMEPIRRAYAEQEIERGRKDEARRARVGEGLEGGGAGGRTGGPARARALATDPEGHSLPRSLAHVAQGRDPPHSHAPRSRRGLARPAPPALLRQRVRVQAVRRVARLLSPPRLRLITAVLIS